MTPASSRSDGPVPAGSLRPGLRLFAIGDVHGQADLLDEVARLIKADLEANKPADARTILLGDYIDRGPQSAQVVARLVSRDFPTTIRTLRGNHEQILLDGLEDAGKLGTWLSNGGLATMQSYGMPTAGYADLHDLHHTLVRALPADHRAFLDTTEMAIAIDGYFFCHAGIEPGVPLERQSADTLLWIRRPFHRSRANHGKVVVHGHTPVQQPESLANRINIDTGAFKTGVLTCLVLENGTRRFLSTGRRG